MTPSVGEQVSDEGKREEPRSTRSNIRTSTRSGQKRLVAKTNISVDHAIFEEFAFQAKRQNKSLTGFANESLLAISKICADGGYPSELYRLWRSVSLLKQVDVITLPSDFIDELIASQYAVDKKNLFKLFRDLGSKLVGVLKVVAEDLDELAELARDFATLLPLKQFRISKAQNGDMVEIGIVGAGRRIESTECTLEFLQSVLNGYGYTVAKHELNIGTIRLWASGRGLKSPKGGK